MKPQVRRVLFWVAVVPATVATLFALLGIGMGLWWSAGVDILFTLILWAFVYLLHD